MKKHRRNLTKVLAISLVASMMFSITVSASSLAALNMEEASLSECTQVVEGIVKGILNCDTSFISQNSALFSSTCYDKISKYTCNNGINGRSIDNIVIDFTYPDGSSSGDSVIMANTQIRYTEYTKLYLFEFHVDGNGDIYGFNAWQY